MAIKIFNAGAYREMMSRIDDKATRQRLSRAAGCVQGLSGHGEAFCPTYPNLRGLPSAQLALGLAKPVDLCPGMTGKEAHEFLLSDFANDRDMVGWFMRQAVSLSECFAWEDCSVIRCGAGIEATNTNEDFILDFVPRDIPTARWFVAVLRDPERLSALLREREGRGPHGERYTYRLVERADEIDHRDLSEGESTGVVTAFERAAERMIEDHVKEYGDDPLAEPPEWWTPLPGARLLLTARELAIEGREMRHCVSGYAPYVKSGRSVIVALNIAGERSTVEFDRSGNVRQHRGVGNETPSNGGHIAAVVKIREAAYRHNRDAERRVQNDRRAMLRERIDRANHYGGCAITTLPDGSMNIDMGQCVFVTTQGERHEISNVTAHMQIGHAPRDIAAGELMRVTMTPVDPITYTDTPSASPSPFWAAYQRGIANTEDA